MKKQVDNSNMLQKSWTRREVLAAGGVALLGLAGCGTENVSAPRKLETTGTSNITATSSPLHTPTPIAETPITLAFTGDVMFGRTVNSHMLATASNDPYPFTYTGDFLRGFDLTISDPRRFQRLQSILAKANRTAARRDARHAAAHHLAILGPLRHQHLEPLLDEALGVRR